MYSNDLDSGQLQNYLEFTVKLDKYQSWLLHYFWEVATKYSYYPSNLLLYDGNMKKAGWGMEK